MSFLQTTRPDGSSVSLLREDGQSEAFEVAPAGGTVVQVAPVNVLFTMTSNMQRFVVAVPGVKLGDAVWTSLNGEPSTPGEKVGTGGGWASNNDEVTLIADYQSGSPVTSLTVPLLVFWFTPPP